MSEAEQLIYEIKQIREQYIDEVGEGRRPWPKSIIDRVLKLGDLGIKPKGISESTLVPYETVCQWRYSRNQRIKKFHNLTVTVPAKSLVARSSSATVTVAETAKNVTVTVTTPDGYLIEGLPAEMVVEVLRAHRG